MFGFLEMWILEGRTTELWISERRILYGPSQVQYKVLEMMMLCGVKRQCYLNRYLEPQDEIVQGRFSYHPFRSMNVLWFWVFFTTLMVDYNIHSNDQL